MPFEQAYIWDRSTRLWHWTFASCVIAGWLLGEFRDFDTVQWHFYLGYTVAALIGWRLIWGVVGPPPVRFATLTRSLRETGVYLSRIRLKQPSGFPGHNPVGVISIFTMLILLSLQVITGLFVEDDALFSAGPLAYTIDSELRSGFKSLHHLNAKVILAVVALHLAAIAFYRIWKKEDLLTPMITGLKWIRKQ